MSARKILICLLVIFAFFSAHIVADESNLTPEEMKQFLLTAKITKSEEIGQGKTHPWKLTLTDGTLTHKAAFQSVDISKPVMQFANGTSELNFKDSYRYDIAAYELAVLLGLGDMMPVTVARVWEQQRGALSWWLPVMMDESTRLEKRLHPPDREAWNRQVYKMQVFAQLVYDADRNTGNVLISQEWKVWMIDFSRAFRLYEKLQDPTVLKHCDRQLLEHLKSLKTDDVYEHARPNLTKGEVHALMVRRDLLVKHFEDLIAEKGETEVLY